MCQTEGKSKNTIAIVTNSIRCFNAFPSIEGPSTDATQAGTMKIGASIAYLQQKRCFSDHPYSKKDNKGKFQAISHQHLLI